SRLPPAYVTPYPRETSRDRPTDPPPPRRPASARDKRTALQNPGRWTRIKLGLFPKYNPRGLGKSRPFSFFPFARPPAGFRCRPGRRRDTINRGEPPIPAPFEGRCMSIASPKTAARTSLPLFITLSMVATAPAAPPEAAPQEIQPR